MGFLMHASQFSSKMSSKKGSTFIIVQEDDLINGIRQMFFFRPTSELPPEPLSFCRIEQAETTNRFPETWQEGEPFCYHFYSFMEQLLVDVRFNEALR
jgi:hypothetical protein